MARLQIAVEQLGAEGFRLEFDAADGAPNIIALAPGGGIHGRYEQGDDTIELHDLRADTLVLSELSWALTRSKGRLRGSSRLSNVEIEAVFARGNARAQGKPPFVGVIRARTMEATVDLALPGTTIHATTVHIDGFEITAGEDGKVTLRIGKATASTVLATLRGTETTMQDVTMPDSIVLENGALRIESITVGSIETRIPDLDTLRPPRDPAPDPDAPATRPKTRPTRPPLPPLPFLDLLNGHLRLNVTTDVTVPILGHHEATHRFALPVEDGIIDYHKLEKSLALLEGLVLDFELEGTTLVLEKDIPLIPFDNRPLLEWPLDTEGMALAQQRRVRLATLVHPQIPESARKQTDKDQKKKGRAVELRRVDIHDIDIGLEVGGPFELPFSGGRLRFGTSEHPAVGALKIQGTLAHVPSTPTPRRAPAHRHRSARTGHRARPRLPPPRSRSHRHQDHRGAESHLRRHAAIRTARTRSRAPNEQTTAGLRQRPLTRP